MVGRPTCGDKYLETSVHMRIHYNPTFLICQHSQYLKRSLIREQVCTSFSALPISSQRKVVVPYSLLSQPHCPLLDSPSTSHTCPLCYPHPHSLICGVPSGSTCQGTIQRSFPKKSQVLPSASAVSPPSHSLPLLPTPHRCVRLHGAHQGRLPASEDSGLTPVDGAEGG